MWKCKHPANQRPKLQNLTMSPITAAVEDTRNGLPDDIREECKLAIKSKRNSSFCNQSSSQQNYSNNQGSNNGQAKNKNKGQNGQKQKNKNSGNSNYDTIFILYSLLKGHVIWARHRLSFYILMNISHTSQLISM
jgi:hypothetical protein